MIAEQSGGRASYTRSFREETAMEAIADLIVLAAIVILAVGAVLRAFDGR